MDTDIATDQTSPTGEYVCPGCGQSLPASAPHTIAWRESAAYGIGTGPEARRHWHTHCFRGRRR